MHHKTVLVCQGTGCVSAGAEQTHASLEREIAGLGLGENVQVKRTGCHGFCQRGPLVVVEPEGIFYSAVKTGDALEIARSLLPQGKPVERLFYRDPVTGRAIPYYRDIAFYRKQQRFVLENCGHIDPEKIDNYLAVGGYRALCKVLNEMTPEQVIDVVKHSGLRGLGGAVFLPGASGNPVAELPARKNMLSAMPMKAILGHFKIAQSWKAILIQSWKECSLPATLLVLK